ncbi:MAG: non-ribosomal peptide synthetase, partial [Candidatus Binatia bacterium]
SPPGEHAQPPSRLELGRRPRENETSHPSRRLSDPPAGQQAIRAKCFHPSGAFVDFKKEEIELSFPERFEAIVRLHPDRVAIKIADQVVSYADLNAIANRLARAILAARGSAPEPIGLLLDNGPALFAAMVGVLKAGKFFVSVDPSLPKARIASLLEDSQATLVLTNRHHSALATPGAIHCPLLDLDSIDQSVASTNLRLPVSPDSRALVFYTSGSSGSAKAVLWTHRVLLHHLMVTTNAFHACADDRISLLASGTSGAVTNGLFALLIGAALLPFDVRKEGVARLASWLLEERISICWLSPPLFRNLSEALTGKEEFADLRLIRLAGDAIYQGDVDLYQRHFPRHCFLVNALSSSEAGLLSIYYVDHTSEISGIEVPVGYSVPDKEILLLDEDGKEVGFDEVGEIVVKSRYLSSGYWRRPDLTDAKFRPHPADRNERLYFTGDLALMRPDGCLIYKGRKDFRVKIRGYGVEFSEVEKVLLEHKAIRQVVVAAPENESGEARLVAYFTSHGHPGPSIAELRGFAKKKLPDYMIPSVFVMLDEIPLMLNGKVDRRALPEPGQTRPEINEAFVAPRTPLEEVLAGIWRQLLRVEPVGIHDDFFELGGHSLLANQVIYRVREALHLELPLRALFEDPTVAGLATQIAQAQAQEAAPKGMASIVAELDSLSDKQARDLLAQESSKTT